MFGRSPRTQNWKMKRDWTLRRASVGLSLALSGALELYLSKRPWDSEFLFSTSDGGRLKDSYVRAMLARYGAIALFSVASAPTDSGTPTGPGSTMRVWT